MRFCNFCHSNILSSANCVVWSVINCFFFFFFFIYRHDESVLFDCSLEQPKENFILFEFIFFHFLQMQRFNCTTKEIECDELKARTVCGTDNQTYTTRCHLLRAQCAGHKVNLKHRGPCKGICHSYSHSHTKSINSRICSNQKENFKKQNKFKLTLWKEKRREKKEEKEKKKAKHVNTLKIFRSNCVPFKLM